MREVVDRATHRAEELLVAAEQGPSGAAPRCHLPARAVAPASRRSDGKVGWDGGKPTWSLPPSGSSAAPRKRYCQRPVISAKRVGEHTGELA